MSARTIRDQTAIIGVGESRYYKRGKAPGNAFNLALDAVRAAAADAGMSLHDLDGVSSFSMDFTDPARLATALGFREFRYSNMFWGGGGGGACGAVGNAAAAVTAGVAEAVVVLRSLSQKEYRFGTGMGGRESTIAGPLSYIVPYGLSTPAQTVALKTQRFLHETGVTQDALAAVALASYEHAQHNPRAVMHGRPLTRKIYDESRMIAEPFHLFDCCQENDGAAAVIVTSAERAKDFRQTPVYILGAAQGSEPGQFIFDQFGDPYASANFTAVAKRLYEVAGVGPEAVDVAQIYENFTGGAVMSIIEHGLCTVDEAADFFTVENLLWKSGRMPLNTSGGNLAECYVHGLELVNEGVRQLRGSSNCQVEGAEVCLVAAAPASAPCSDLLLRR